MLPPLRRSAAEQRLSRRLGRALLDEFSFQPCNLAAQEVDAFCEFSHRKQGKILTDLMGACFLCGFVVEDRHRRSSVVLRFACPANPHT